jgi:hypothetical protein
MVITFVQFLTLDAVSARESAIKIRFLGSDQPPSVAQGGKGVAVPGGTVRRKRFHASSQFADHIADDVLPALLDKPSTQIG